MSIEEQIEVGDKVHYCPTHGIKENGMVKSIKNDTVFVVYKCNNEWSRYYDYTGNATNLKDLKKGWI